MKHLIFLLTILSAAVLLARCSEDNRSEDTDSDSDSSSDSDSDGDTDTDTYRKDCYDDEFPPPNEPDGCKRILLTKLPDGTVPKRFGADSPAISRDGNTAVFATQRGSLLPEHDGKNNQIYAVDLSPGKMEIVSVSSKGELGDGTSEGFSSISADGRYVAFISKANNLTDVKVSSRPNVYVRDRQEGKTEIISISYDGNSGSDNCYHPIISADGRFVVFDSTSSNLVPGDTNEESDLFLRDRLNKTTERLNVTEDGKEVSDRYSSGWDYCPAKISDDGRYVLFQSRSKLSSKDDDPVTDNVDEGWDVYLRDRQTGKNLMPGLAPDGYHTRRPFTASLNPEGNKVLLSIAVSTHFLKDEKYPTYALIAHLKGTSFTYEPIYRKDHEKFYSELGGMSADGRFIGSLCTEDYGLYLGERPSNGSPCEPIENACVLNRESGEVFVVGASEDGVAGIIPNYDPHNMVEWVELAISGDGSRMLLSSIMYGIVDVHKYPVSHHNRLIYLRDCRK